MINKEDFIVIHALHEKGHNISEIAKLTKLDRKTVRKRLKEVELSPSVRMVKQPSKLEAYKPYIRDFIAKDTHRIPYSSIFADIQAMGYTGGRSILQEFLTKEYRSMNLQKDPVVRFETLPGEQMQVDWTTIRYGRNPIYAFVATLGYSRHTFVHFTDNMEAKTLIICHDLSFLFFGGVPHTILYDNMKQVVVERNRYGNNKHKYHDELFDLSKRCGFSIKLCKPYRAKTKGKVERFNSYLKGNFYRPLAIKLKDANVTISHQILNNHIGRWLITASNRIHGTTNKKPAELFTQEQPYLIPYLKPDLNAGVSSKQKSVELPKLTVPKCNLAHYDELLSGAVA